MSKAVYAGSFDPFHNGHLDIVKKASKVFDEVIILIANNPAKIRKTKTSEMVIAIRETLEAHGLDNCSCAVAPFNTYTVVYTAEHDADFLIRGLRNEEDFAYEEEMARINHLINPLVETIYFRADNTFLSSSFIKEQIEKEDIKSIMNFVPASVYLLLDKEK